MNRVPFMRRLYVHMNAIFSDSEFFYRTYECSTVIYKYINKFFFREFMHI